MNTFSKMWGIKTPAEAIAIITEQKKEIIGEPRNLEEQAISLVGRDIYERLVKGYTEKQWGRSCAELPAFIIRRLPVRFIYDNNYFSDRYQGIPVGGYTAVIEKMLKGADNMPAKWQLLIFLGQQTILNMHRNGTAEPERSCCQ